jgi:hypothetical protein
LSKKIASEDIFGKNELGVYALTDNLIKKFKFQKIPLSPSQEPRDVLKNGDILVVDKINDAPHMYVVVSTSFEKDAPNLLISSTGANGNNQGRFVRAEPLSLHAVGIDDFGRSPLYMFGPGVKSVSVLRATEATQKILQTGSAYRKSVNFDVPSLIKGNITGESYYTSKNPPPAGTPYTPIPPIP